jgi:DNA-binding protein HU-beta
LKRLIFEGNLMHASPCGSGRRVVVTATLGRGDRASVWLDRIKPLATGGWPAGPSSPRFSLKGEQFMAKATGKALTKSEIAATLAEKVGISKKQVNQFFMEQSALAYKQAKNSFVLPGIGKLVLTRSAPREMVMRFGPDAGKTKKIPAKTRVKFRIAKAAKDAILGSK